MKVLVIGSGGREHALADTIARDPEVREVHAAPGNPGMELVADLHEDIDIMDGAAVAKLATELGVDLVVIGPEAPLVAGVADAVRAAGVACFGPTKEAAMIEGSKSFAKEIMAAAGVPTAASVVCANLDEVKAAMERFGAPYVIKEDGLAGGKGVLVTNSPEEALAHAEKCHKVVVEEYLEGPEVSFFAVCDGKLAYPMLACQDYKRVGAGDTGPNTGGMGAYTPLPWAPADLNDRVMKTIINPVIAEMAKRGIPFQGLLYAGLALTADGPKVIEFNARFGDPETQPLLTLLESPLGQLLYAAAQGRLSSVEAPKFHKGAAIGIVVAADGYPEHNETGGRIPRRQFHTGQVKLFHSGTRRANDDNHLEIAAGRVMCAVARGSSLKFARNMAYATLNSLYLPGTFFRRDIGEKAVLGEIRVPQPGDEKATKA
ncbi:phosphoribosylamine--glycine ligase [Granulicoccus phenolivorans]|uniref:phosphoribosylamine--glycine ligase n=1 Tax=Granulicoccus phenolivorans TaxID=266854 RepID=UPI00042122AD|nr:phosphoribosylamine--glycine ligase [Granulicoccus phenolivorans]